MLRNLLCTLPESSSVKAVNLVKKSVTVIEIMKFSKGIVFLLAHPVDEKTIGRVSYFCFL